MQEFHSETISGECDVMDLWTTEMWSLSCVSFRHFYEMIRKTCKIIHE